MLSSAFVGLYRIYPMLSSFSFHFDDVNVGPAAAAAITPNTVTPNTVTHHAT
jgi:hypothetical protein